MITEKKTKSIKEAKREHMLRQMADSQKSGSDYQKAAGNHQKTTENHQKTAGNHQKTTENHQKTAGNHQKTAGSHQETTEKQQRATGKQQRATGKQTAVNVRKRTKAPDIQKPQQAQKIRKSERIQENRKPQQVQQIHKENKIHNTRKKDHTSKNMSPVMAAAHEKNIAQARNAALQRKVTENHHKRKRRAKHQRRIVAVLVAMLTVYCVAVFSEIPVVAKWRNIYIETAMTTKSHQWLAEYFIPGYIIDEVMADTHEALDAQADLISNWSASIQNNSRETFLTESKIDTFYSTYWELDTDSVRGYIDEHYDIENGGYENILIEDFDAELGLLTPTGDPIIVIDTANNLLIIDVSQGDYHGKLAIVKDASQIDLAKSKNFGSFGQEVSEFGEENGAILAINASRFRDIGGHGNGGTVKGSLVLGGEEYGSPEKGYWRFAGFKEDNLLNICSYPKKEIKDYKWGLEVYPALIVNGENVIDNTLGMGIQPRTAIGQSASGDFMLLVIDGRQVGYSLGCTVADCAEVLTEYQAYQGMNLDGGSSTVMWYKGELITKPCSVSGRGRYMPDAILVKPAQKEE